MVNKMELVAKLHESLLKNVDQVNRNKKWLMLLEKDTSHFMVLGGKKYGWKCTSLMKNNIYWQIGRDLTYLLGIRMDMDIKNMIDAFLSS
jgi:hypothetical protein